VEGGGHTWFGNPARSSPERFGGRFSDDLDMNRVAWEFFKAHPMEASQ
jgi:polyhydroxybutyrate depolymerase